MFRTVLTSLLTLSLSAKPPQEAQRVRAAQDHLRDARFLMGMDENHSFVLRDSHSDALGQTHGRFTQHYKGVRVWGGDVITHTDKNDKALPHTNALRLGIHLDVKPSLARHEVLAVVLRDLNLRGTFLEAPQVETVIYPVSPAVKSASRFVLAFYIHVEVENTQDGLIHRDYLIDAHTSAILEKWDTLHTDAPAQGIGYSQFSGIVNIQTTLKADGTYELRDMTRGTGGKFGSLAVVNANHANTLSTNPGPSYTNAINIWGNETQYVEGSLTSDVGGQTAAVDAMYGFAKTWDFYVNVLGRNGWDGKGTSTYGRVHISSNYSNAFWSDSCNCISFGDGWSILLYKSFTSLDIVAHEMSHGLCASTAKLIYKGESGGLNEANSDIFGTMVELYARSGSGSSVGTGGNWTIGEQVRGLGPLRYMYKPSKDTRSPDAWSATLGTLDVHYSSGPMNRAFYFLSQGATLTGDTSTTYLPKGMTGIGNDKAIRLWYRAVSTYMTSTTDYAQARVACINAATDLYGADSAETQAVWNAFAGVNVGATFPIPPPTITTQPVSVTVAPGATATFFITSSSATYQWFKGGVAISGATSGTYSFVTSINDNGSTYSVTVTNAGGSTTSSIVTLTVTNPYKELIVNGGFEGTDGWAGTTAIFGSRTTQAPYSGTRSAYFQGLARSTTQVITQSITIPATATEATLTFWLHVDSDEHTTLGIYDIFKPQIVFGSSLINLATVTNLNKAPGYAKYTINVLPYKGRSITLRFLSSEDSTFQTSFVLDDVSVKYR